MKHFRLILISMRVIVGLLFAGNVMFMVQLYNSIKDRYISDVEQCLVRVDQMEMVDRIIDAGFGDDEEVVWIMFGLQKNDVGAAMGAEALQEMDYSQGFRRPDKQILSVIAKHLRDYYSDRIGPADVARLEESFRRDLSFSGFYPD